MNRRPCVGCRLSRAIPRLNVPFDTVSIYYAEVGRIGLLTAEEEKALFARLERLRHRRDSLRALLEAQGVHLDVEPSPDDESARVLLRRYRALSKAVDRLRARLAEANLRLAVALAKKHQGRGLTLADLIQEANIGLLRAVDKYDVRRGVRFAAYAAWWIQQSIGLAICAQARLVRLPAYLLERQRQLRTVREVFGDSATLGDLAKAVGITPAQARRALNAEMDTFSLDAPLSPESRTTASELLADCEEKRPDVLVERAELLEQVERLLASLDPRTERILKLRYGFEDGIARSLQEVGEEMNLSRERVRQIEMLALRRFRTRGNVERLDALTGRT